MKTLLIGLLFLGFTSLTYAQTNGGIQAEKLDDVVISPLNISYLNTVKDENTPQVARQLENKAGRFDITESPVFDRNFEAYEVIFNENSENKGRIVATYDNKGKILSSMERFKDVALPPAVRNSVYKSYPGWTILNDTYLVSYYENRAVKKTYKLKIKKDNTKKTLRLDTEGNIK